jgi:DNA repair exonuclease SbcCD ATPase subunit
MSGDAGGGFVAVFEQRVTLLRKRLKDELNKDKKERNRRTLKSVIKEIKSWNSTLKQLRKSSEHKCPHCGGQL